MSQPDIFAELNQVLSKPNLGRDETTSADMTAEPTVSGHPDPVVTKRIGYRASQLLFTASKIGPLAAPTRSRDHRFRVELSSMYDPDLHGPNAEGANT